MSGRVRGSMPDDLAAVARSRDRAPGPSARSGWGRVLRERGQKRVLEPPAMITAYAVPVLVMSGLLA